MININNKSFIFGLGTGIIILSLMSLLFYSFDYKNKIINENEVVPLLSNDKIIENAKKLGMVFVGEVTKEDIQEGNEKELDNTTQPEDIVDVNNENEESIIEVNIPEGLAFYQISKILFENDIIQNEKEFEDYIYEKKLTKKLFYGTFELKKNMDFKSIITILTKG